MAINKFILQSSVFSVFLLGALGIPVAMSIVREPQQLLPQAQEQKEIKRSLASIPTRKEIVPKKELSPVQAAIVIDLKCPNKNEFVVESAMLRFKGLQSDCISNHWKDLRLTNETNGFTAEIFFHKEFFTTDYIDLQEGQNEITFHATKEDGEKVSQKIVIQRRSIASQSEKK